MKTISYSVILYMLMALTWWSILLNKKNAEAFIAQTDLISLKYEKTFGVSDYDLTSDSEYLEIEKKFKKQQYMILGEAIVFALILIIGIYLIYRSFKRELETSRRQQNFLLSITHELKSPLASIGLIYDTLIKRDLKKEKIQALADAGLDEKDRLEKLINNLLMVAKLDHAYKYHLEAIEVNEKVVSIVHVYESIYPKVEFRLKASKPIIANLDQESFVSVIKNLLDNAIKYRSSDRNLQIDISISDDDKYLHLKIEDNGIGIAESERKNIFDKFYRVGSEYTRKTKGTGLGLYIVKKIIEQHKGSIKVLSRQPHGSSFVTKWKK